MPFADHYSTILATKVGSSGISLSGGQKQRLALARAVYACKPVVMLDDIFSGLDTDTEEHVFKALFARNGLFRRLDTTVILATHAVHRLSYADHIIALGSDGSIMEQGTLEDLKANGGYVALLKAHYKDEANHENNGQQKDTTSALVDSDQMNRMNGTEEELARGNGDFALYFYYFGSVHWASSLCWMGLLLLEGLLPKVSELVVKFWVTSLDENGSSVNSFYLGIYASMSIIAIIALVIGAYHLIMFFCPRSAETLHERVLKSVMHAPLSFFTSVDTGTTMNRYVLNDQTKKRKRIHGEDWRELSNAVNSNDNYQVQPRYDLNRSRSTLRCPRSYNFCCKRSNIRCHDVYLSPVFRCRDTASLHVSVGVAKVLPPNLTPNATFRSRGKITSVLSIY